MPAARTGTPHGMWLVLPIEVGMATRFAILRFSVLLAAMIAALVATPRPARAQRPDAELRGITVVGVLVEPFGPAATACGFGRDTFERALAKSLADAGFKVVPHQDEDTYLDVRVETLGVQPGVCVSRFDTTLFTNTTARLSYQAQPVTVRASLLHSAGLSGGGVNGHAASVLRDVQQRVEQFMSRIRAASK
jgi:hypothetical protein